MTIDFTNLIIDSSEAALTQALISSGEKDTGGGGVLWGVVWGGGDTSGNFELPLLISGNKTIFPKCNPQHVFTETQKEWTAASGTSVTLQASTDKPDNADSKPDSVAVLPTNSRGVRVPRLPVSIAVGYDPADYGERAPSGWKDDTGIERSATLARLDGEGTWFGYNYNRELISALPRTQES
eukprot:GHVR01151328.1.p1 GENE.GHVR01151328.1~~GHVR01151328.1.p1  ORF type:complete len:182 (+),score=36.48 GHVR01151328.1:123-668(+)